jgi:hypothetical protein
MKRSFRYGAAALAVIILFVLVVACGGGGTTTQTYKVKDQFKVGKATWKVLGVQITQDIARADGSGKFTAEGNFVILNLQLTNDSTENANITGDEVEITDDAGNSYAFDSRNNNVYINAMGKTSLTKAAIAPGKTATGYLIFDVSKDAKGMRAKMKDIEIQSRAYAYVDLGS